jgi:AcrR family transcriptional regulator
MPGRPRDGELDQRLLAAAWSLLTSQGYGALTLAKVAARARAHRTDLYRRWATKPQLVVDVLDEHLPPISDVDTGALGSDLRAIVEDFAASWSSPWIDGLVGLTADLQHDPDAELAFRRLAERRGQPMANCIARAVQRGEIRHAAVGVGLGDLIEGPLMHRRMIGREPLTPDYLDAVARFAHRLLSETTAVR